MKQGFFGPIVAAILATSAVAQSSSPRLRVPPGFTVELVAGPPLVEHPMFANFDEQGRLYVAESAGQNLKAADLLQAFPNRILVLDPADDKGRFTKSRVFADKMSFPMGVLPYRGSVFTASPPSFWKLTDTKKTGVADLRQEIVTRFNFTGNAADIHGPFLGPDGRLYWCDGRHGHEINRPDGGLMKGKASRIFRCKPDGSDLEVVCGGGMDNPVEIAFTDEGEAFATVNILNNQPARNDGILFAIEGGNFPWHEAYKEMPRTGDLLPAAADLGWVAPSGLMRYRSGFFGEEFKGNLFSAQFNRSRIQRHIVTRVGAGFAIKSEDFLTSDDKNFHPTDVLEDADGSLLVVDTGGWFRIGCPTSKIAQPEFKGAIYRIRKEGLKRADGPIDPKTLITKERSRQLLVWEMTKIETDQARLGVREMLSTDEFGTCMAALHSVGLYRDGLAIERVKTFLGHRDLALRRQAATALGRIGKVEAVPDLLKCLENQTDRFLEHACIYAVIQINRPEAVTPFLKDGSPFVQRAALIALDQMAAGKLERQQVVPFLNAEHLPLRTSAIDIVASRPGWGAELVGLLGERLQNRNLDRAQVDQLVQLLLSLSKEPAIQDMIGSWLTDDSGSDAARLALFDVVSRAPLPKLPDIWLNQLARSLDDPKEKVALQAMNVVRSRQLATMDIPLSRLAQDGMRSDDIRLAALAALAPRLKQVGSAEFAFLLDRLQAQKTPLGRLQIVGLLSKVPLTDEQRSSLVPLVASAGAIELPGLLSCFEGATAEKVGVALLSALPKSSGITALSSGQLERAFRGFPDSIKDRVPALEKHLAGDQLQQKAKVDSLLPLLKDGSEDRGRLIFYGVKAACSACHAVKNQGTRIGPDLTTIGAVRSGRDLLEAILYPSASFARGFEPFVVETRSGMLHTGLVTRESSEDVILVTADRNELRVPRTDIEAMAPGRVSIMPQGLQEQLNATEMRDLLAYLMSLK